MDAVLSPCSPRTMASFTCGQSQAHADMDAGFCLASLLAFQSMETQFDHRLILEYNEKGFSSPKQNWCYFKSNHNLSVFV